LHKPPVDPRLTPYTDAAPPGEPAIIVVLGGAIKVWWEACPACKGYGTIDAYPCRLCNSRGELYGGLAHLEYKQWRETVRRRLIEERFLTYAPHEAFKGTWDERAQAINDAAIRTADIFLVLSPSNLPSNGTDAEIKVAEKAGTLVASAPPGTDLDELVTGLHAALSAMRFKRPG
jgi:hypothetical protein